MKKTELQETYSWDAPQPPIINKDYLILGYPGSGYETLIYKEKKAKNIAEFGLRESSLSVEDWHVDLNSVWNAITSPWNSSTIWAGYANNWLPLSTLPWRAVFFVLLPHKLLYQRIHRYRTANGLSKHDGLSSSEYWRRKKRDYDLFGALVRSAGERWFAESEHYILDSYESVFESISAIEDRFGSEQSDPAVLLYDKKSETDLAVLEYYSDGMRTFAMNRKRSKDA